MRNIKPGFFKNEELAACQPLARLLFAGLWCWADCNGIVEDRPLKLKAEILPFDNCDCNLLLGELAARGLVVRYTVRGRRYLIMPTFRKHQNLHPKESPIHPQPAPPPSEASNLPASDQSVASRGFDAMHGGKNADKRGESRQAAESRGFASQCAAPADCAEQGDSPGVVKETQENRQTTESLTESRGSDMTGNCLATDQSVANLSFPSLPSCTSLPPYPPEGEGGLEKTKDERRQGQAAHLAQEWLFYLARKTRRGYPRGDGNHNMVSPFAELLRLGYAYEAMLAEIRSEQRDRTEFFWQFRDRVKKTLVPNQRQETPEERAARHRRKNRELDNLDNPHAKEGRNGTH